MEIHGAEGKTRYLIKHVSTFKDKEQTREFLHVDAQVKGPLSYGQYCGVELKESAREAHLAHFDGLLTMGPLTVNAKVPPELALVTGDNPTDLRGHVGTIDTKNGCWVVVWSHRGDKSAFPDGVFPIVDVHFPPKMPGDPPLKRQYRLDKFC